MGVSRRDFVLLSLSAMVAGCASAQQVDSGGTPEMAELWPDPVARPTPLSPGTTMRPPTHQAAAPRVVQAQPPVVVGGISAIPRSQWAAAGPIMNKMNAMNGVNRITIHHEGWTPVYFTDKSTTSARIERVRQGHLSRLNAGDIGYHYIVDRAGRVWQGRDTRYQGAHVKANNEHNIGVMCLGNFDQQQTSDVQMSMLRDTVSKLMRQYRVSATRVYTHQEINPTACPGRSLQPRFVSLRRNGNLG